MRFAIVGWILVGTAAVRAGSSEQREYSVLVNGKDAGTSTLTILVEDDGREYVKGAVAVKFQALLVPVTFVSEVQEWRRDGRITHLKALTNDNGKKTEVSVKAEVDKLLVAVNGQVRPVTWEAWTNTYWKLADRRFHNAAVPILEADTGKSLVGRLEFVGAEKLTVLGRPEETFRFRVVGIPVPVELWYDRHHLLVRQEFVESGVRTIVHLVRRGPATQSKNP